MTNFTAFYDACVLYPAPLRDLLIQLAFDGLHRAKWSNRVHDEWIRNALKNNTNLTKEKLEKTKQLMNAAILDCLVEGFEEIESSLNLPDKDDHHVLAAAIVSSSDVIVTFNIKDFPKEYLNKYGIEPQHPDKFICHLLDLNFDAVTNSILSIQERLKNPPYTINDYLNILEKQGLSESISLLKKNWN